MANGARAEDPHSWRFPPVLRRKGCAWSGRNRLAAHPHHMIDSSADEVVRDVRAAALCGHQPRFTLEALEGVLVKRVVALGNARGPGRLISRLRSTGNPLSVAR